MSSRPFCFVHASDLHLEQPPCGISEVPDHLRDALIEAPYGAAERVFDTALAEDAGLVILSGDVLAPEKTGPRGPLWLVSQFERLAERAVEVYWAWGRVEAASGWPALAPLPANVHVFPPERTEQFIYCREAAPAARLIGTSWSRGRTARIRDFSADPGGLLSIGVIHGKPDPQALRRRKIDYWALGGSHTRSMVFSPPQGAHYPGTPQGRRPEEPGPHGCLLVQVDADREVRISFAACDTLRWCQERVAVDAGASPADLEGRLHERLRALREAAPGVHLLICWTIVTSGRLAARLRRGSLAAELLEGLRSRFGLDRPAAWSVWLKTEPPSALPAEWFDQDTIRGEFLREIRRLQARPEEPIRLDADVPEGLRAGPLGRAAVLREPAQRDKLLQEAAALGADLLNGEDPMP